MAECLLSRTEPAVRTLISGLARRNLSLLFTVTVVVSVLVFQASAALTQEHYSHERKGLSGRIGIGPGRLDFNCGPAITRGELSAENCIFEGIATSGIGFINVGYAFNQHVVVGVEFDSWGRQRSVDGGYMGTVTLHYYPSAVSGFFVDVGAGTSTFVGPAPGFDERGSGWGLTGGLGYDLRVGASTSLTFQLKSLYGDQGVVGAPIISNTSGIQEAAHPGTWHSPVAHLNGVRVLERSRLAESP